METKVGDVMMKVDSCPPRDGAIYKALGKVMAGLSVIEKGQKNEKMGYWFRGIDDLLNTAHGLMVKASVVVLPHVLSEPVVELGPVAKSGVQYYRSIIKACFEFLSTEDGSSVVSGPFIGEGIDHGDKATNCAMTAAYKWCFFQTFCVPVKGGLRDSELGTEIDADAALAEQGRKTSDELAGAFAQGLQTGVPASVGQNAPGPSNQPPQAAGAATGQSGASGAKSGAKDSIHRDELKFYLDELAIGDPTVKGTLLKGWSIFTISSGADKGKQKWADDVDRLSTKWLNQILAKARPAYDAWKKERDAAENE